MHTFILYQQKVALILIAFYLCFKCFLSREKMHKVNRIVIVSTSILSFVLPLCAITIHKTANIPETIVPEIINEVGTMEPSVIGKTSKMPWEPLIITIFWLGAFFVLCRTLLGIYRVVRLINSGERKELYGSEVIVCDKNIPPFSWMKWIVMSKEDFNSGNRLILEHEKAHIRLGHSIDVLLFDLMSVFQWFNPAAWLFKRELRAVHEYEADDAVLREGANIKEYQYSLIRKAVSASGYSITNSFNHSILKNRITMMSKSNATAMKWPGVAYILPLVCGTLALNARTVTDCKVSENSSSTDERAVRIEVKTDGNGDIHYLVNGESIVFGDIPDALNSLPEGNNADKVEILAPTEVRCDVIYDIRELLRNASVLKVQYSCPDLGSVPMRIPPENKVVEKSGLKLIEPSEAVKNMPKEMVHYLCINKNSKYLYLRFNKDKNLYDTIFVTPDELLNIAAESIRSNHQTMICLQTDTATPYGTYVTALKELSNAVSLIRNEYANGHFGKQFEELDSDECGAVLKEIPQNICEIAPKTAS